MQGVIGRILPNLRDRAGVAVIGNQHNPNSVFRESSDESRRVVSVKTIEKAPPPPKYPGFLWKSWGLRIAVRLRRFHDRLGTGGGLG